MTATLTCISPIDGSVYAERPVLTHEATEDAVARARAAQTAWSARPLDERIERVMAGVARVGEMNDEVVPELAWQMGRPVTYGGEFSGFNERATYMAGIASDALAPMEISDDDGFRRTIKRVPHGLVLVIAPWNYPYMTAVNTVVPALIAGNAVLLKHATQTLLVGERMARAFHEAGVPEDVCQNLFLDHETVSRLIAARSFGFVNFTGSVGGGKAMERAAAGTFTNLGLELGGKDPGYVMEDADIDLAAETLIDGAMFNSGQSCCGIERIYVTDSVYDAFVEKAVAIVKNYRLGNPLDSDTTLGPMAHVRFAAEVRTQVSEALAAGATAHIETFAQDDGAAYVSPQVLTDVTHDMRIMRDETFGPVVGIMKVSSDAEAIALMNDSAFGLTASLWTHDIERAETIGDAIETGTVFMNRCDYLDPALCWTGCKDTGRGGALSVIGYHNLTRPKSYHLKKKSLRTMQLTGNWSYPTAIRFGAGRIGEIADACAAAGISKPLLVTDRGLRDMAITTRTLDLLDDAGLGRAIFADVDPNPTDKNVAAGLAAYRAGGHDGVVAFGGGSGVDLGKVLAFMAGQTRPLWDFEDIGDYWTRADASRIDPIVAVPTTAGTGSEVGRASVITNSETQEKKIIFHPKILPSVVICDPELTVSMPDFITAGTGMDAFAHCLEAYCAPTYHPMAQGMALEGMRLVKENLPRAFTDGHDLEARAHMMSAAAIGATAFQKGLGAIHAVSHPIGAIHHTHHGTTNAVMMQPVLKFNEAAVRDLLSRAASYLGIYGGFDGFYDFVGTLNETVNIPKNLTELGLREPDVDRLAKAAINDPCAGGNPVKMTLENTRQLIESSL